MVWPGVVTLACNPSTLGGKVGQIIRGQEFQTSLVNTVKLHLYQKYTHTQISQTWWQALVIPATREAETELLETRKVEVAVSQDRAIALQPGQQE